MNHYTLYFYTSCPNPKREAEYNDWYSYTHIPDLSKAKGLVAAKRYVNEDQGSKAKYLASYEFCTDNIKESLLSFFQLVRRSFESGRHIDCIESVNVVNTPFVSCYKEIEIVPGREPSTLEYPRVVPEALEELEERLRAPETKGI